LFVCQGFLLDLKITEPSQWEQLDKVAPNDAGHADAHSDKELYQIKGLHLHDGCNSLNLNERYLEPDGYEEHNNKEPVVKEACKNIDLIWQQLLSIDLIEDLQHHIHVE